MLPVCDHRAKVFDHPQSSARTLFLLEAEALAAEDGDPVVVS
jgi:hypothetical protein